MNISAVGTIKAGRDILHESFAFTIEDDTNITRLGFVVTTNTEVFRKTDLEPIVVLTAEAFDRFMQLILGGHQHSTVINRLRGLHPKFIKGCTTFTTDSSSLIAKAIESIPKAQLSNLGTP